MIGCVGDDDFGRVNLDRLRRDGVDVSGHRGRPRSRHRQRLRALPRRRRPRLRLQHQAQRVGPHRARRRGARVLARSDHLHVMGTSLFSPSIVDIVDEAVATIKAQRRHGLVRPEPPAGDARPAGLARSLRAAVPPLRPVPAERPGTLSVHRGEGRTRRPSTRSWPRASRPSCIKRGAEGAELFRRRGARLASPASRSRRSIRPAPATVSAPPSSVAGCAACRPPRRCLRRRQRRARRDKAGTDGGRLEPGRTRRLSRGAAGGAHEPLASPISPASA